jgi:hypothetical protein
MGPDYMEAGAPGSENVAEGAVRCPAQEREKSTQSATAAAESTTAASRSTAATAFPLRSRSSSSGFMQECGSAAMCPTMVCP